MLTLTRIIYIIDKLIRCSYIIIYTFYNIYTFRISCYVCKQFNDLMQNIFNEKNYPLFCSLQLLLIYLLTLLIIRPLYMRVYKSSYTIYVTIPLQLLQLLCTICTYITILCLFLQLTSRQSITIVRESERARANVFALFFLFILSYFLTNSSSFFQMLSSGSFP